MGAASASIEARLTAIETKLDQLIDAMIADAEL